MAHAPINKIINFSSVDGPGNRMAIFLQSCPFSCWYCHNPETMNMCIQCRDCVQTCPSDALKIVDGKVQWIENNCTQCDTCISVCKYHATPKILDLSEQELFERTLELKDYIRGVTMSGGECMNHAEFLYQYFKCVKTTGLTTLLDSNGYYRFMDYPELMSVTDGVMLDVKASDETFHKLLTGQENKTVLLNLKELLEANKLQEVRIVLLPNYPEQNENTVRFVSEIIKDKAALKLLRYRPFGVREEGLKQLGFQNTLIDEAKRCESIAASLGVTDIEIR